MLADKGLRDAFEIVISGDTLPEKKPSPLPLLHAAEFFGAEPGRALMIGDSVSDVKAARAAGFSIICMSYGYNHGQDIRDAKPDAVIDSMIATEGPAGESWLMTGANSTHAPLILRNVLRGSGLQPRLGHAERIVVAVAIANRSHGCERGTISACRDSDTP